MSLHSFESNRAQKIARDASMKEDASKRRAGMAHKRKADCAHNRKVAAILAARIKDWETFTASAGFRAPAGAFHKPGSMNRF